MSAIVAVSIFFAIAACSDQGGADLLAPVGPELGTYGHTLIECPVNEAKSASGTLDARGGSIRLEQHELRLPLLGVSGPTQFSVTAPVTNYMELRIRANDGDSFTFNKPATITIDYSRCARSNVDKFALTVWKIDPETKTLVQHMGGADDKIARTVTFSTDGLSTYAIAR